MIRLIEPYVDEIIAVLETHLPARVTAIAAASPVLVLPQIVKFAHGEKQNYPMPAIDVIPARSPIVDDAMDALLIRHRIVIGIHATYGDEEELTRRLERYAAAVIQTLMDRREAGGFTFPLQIATEDGSEIDWGALSARDKTLFQRDVFFEVVATVDDTRT